MQKEKTMREPHLLHTYQDLFLSEFHDRNFQIAFMKYFEEMDIHLDDWNGLWQEMNEDKETRAFVRVSDTGSVIGFIQFKPITFKSDFFEETCGFIREFWVDAPLRNQRHGTELITLAEKYFIENHIFTCILSTDSAERFYKRHGYVKASGCLAKNHMDVYVKRILHET